MKILITNDDGWEAKIDGQKTDIIESGGMMLINIPAGHHAIECSYVTPGYSSGLIISIISLLLYLGIWVKFDNNKTL